MPSTVCGNGDGKLTLDEIDAVGKDVLDKSILARLGP